MTTYVFRKGKIVKKTAKNSSDAAYVITDEMSATRHMADGKLYTSKAKFRRATKDAGCVEVGNDTNHMLAPRAPKAFNPEVRRREIRESIRRQLHGRPA